ncbi:MAG: TetR/AcrR family transcriptional regulator [Bdellovibrionaceae bacterium]|nr:TetR/AcrR family transcriptional regulator [Bdellovibrio sp.]
MALKTNKQIQKEDSKERILTVSARLFRTQGFAATGIDQVMSQASLTAGAFYAHFKSKKELFEKSLERALDNSKILLTKDTEGLSGEEKTNAVLKRYCSVSHRDFPEKGCVLPAVASDIYRGTTQSTKIVTEYIEKWINLIAENISEHLPEEIKRQQALQIVSRSVGAILLSRIVRDSSLSDQLLAAAQKI